MSGVVRLTMLNTNCIRLATPGEGAAVFGGDSSQPSGPTIKLNVDAVVEFGEFGCSDLDAGRWQSREWVGLSTGVLCGRAISVSVVVSGFLLIMIMNSIIIIIVHGGQVHIARIP